VRWVKTTGRLIYDPARPNLRKQSRNTPWWLIAEITGHSPEDFSAYYRWHLRRHGIGLLQPTAWKPHVTILDGRQEVQSKFHHLWKKYNGNVISLEYGIDIEKRWKFWVLPVRCEFFSTIRKELGFYKEYPFHITVGREYELPEKG